MNSFPRLYSVGGRLVRAAGELEAGATYVAAAQGEGYRTMPYEEYQVLGTPQGRCRSVPRLIVFFRNFVISF